MPSSTEFTSEISTRAPTISTSFDFRDLVGEVDVYVLFCLDPLSHLAIDASCMKLMHTRTDFKLHTTN